MLRFESPEALWYLLILPLAWLALEALRRRHLRRLERQGVLFRARARSLAGRLAAGLFALGLGAAIVAVARPIAQMPLVLARQPIILAMDVSASMAAEDIPPSRLEAAQEAAKKFVSGLPPNVKVGIVSYARTAHVVQVPTIDRIAVRTTIDELVLQPGTAIGSGLVVALATAFPDLHIDTMESPPGKDAVLQALVRRLEFARPAENARTPPAIVVLLSDGQNTAGVGPGDAARLAAKLGVRVFTIGFGTPAGAEVAFGGWRGRMKLDEGALRAIAATTGGQYYAATSGEDLRSVYAQLADRIAIEVVQTELGALFSLAAVILLVSGSSFALRNTSRII